MTRNFLAGNLVSNGEQMQTAKWYTIAGTNPGTIDLDAKAITYTDAELLAIVEAVLADAEKERRAAFEAAAKLCDAGEKEANVYDRSDIDYGRERMAERLAEDIRALAEKKE